MHGQRFATFLGLCALAGSLGYGLSGASADSGGSPKLVELGNALSGLPDNAAWQGVANDGTHWYLLTSISEEPPFPRFENVIRKYRISDGVLVAERRHAYPTGYPGGAAFSSGEVIHGRLHVTARGADGGDMSDVSKVLIYDTSTLVLEDEIDVSHGDYAVPEGVARKHDHYWVIFGGRGTLGGDGAKCAIVKYDTAWNPIKAYELFDLPLGENFGGQGILWISDDEILTNTHEDGPVEKEEFDRWRWTGSGFDLVARYQRLDDDPERKMGQGFTRLGDHLYFAARYSDRLVKAEMVDPAIPTPAPTATPKVPDGDTDGDTIPNDADPDDDNDGCSDLAEQGPKVYLGGLRDPHTFWDFFDTPTGDPLTRDGSVSGLEFFAVLQRFGSARVPPPTKEEALAEALTPPYPASGYHPAYDRSPVAEGGSGPPDGAISGLDFFLLLRQFGHSCA